MSNKHIHNYRKGRGSVDVCDCGKFRHNEKAGPAIEEMPAQQATTVYGYDGHPGGIMNTQKPWSPQFSKWRHGGYYVTNVRYLSGAVGCVSNNYPDGKWRIVCDKRPFDQQPTFKTRTDAAIAERDLAIAEAQGA